MSIRTELLLTRHGEAVCNTAGLVGGPATCTGLTSRGRDQVAALARALEHEHRRRPFDVLYAGPRARTRESATILAERVALEPIILADLRGPDHGDADGRPWSEVKKALGGNPQRHPDLAYAVGAEPWTAYLQRAGQTLQEIITKRVGQRILIAGHGETVLAAHALLLELTPGLSARAGFAVDHAAITCWQEQVNRFGHATWMLTRHNDTRHLPPPGPADTSTSATRTGAGL